MTGARERQDPSVGTAHTTHVSVYQLVEPRVESIDLDTGRLEAVLTMFRISRGELARFPCISPAKLSHS